MTVATMDPVLSSDEDDATQLCTFTLAGLTLAIEVQAVQEVIREQPTTPVPLTGAAVVGLMNLRGQIVTTLDLRTRLRLPPAPEGAPRMVVVLRPRENDGPVALLVDEIGDVIDVPDSAHEQPPATLRGALRELATGTFKLPDALVMVLDPLAVTTPAAG